MHVATVLPAFNVAPFLGDALRSMLEQRHTDWSLFVVDDGSTDDPAAIVAAFPDDRISFIRQPNAGVSCARNAGLRAALLAGHPPTAAGSVDVILGKACVVNTASADGATRGTRADALLFLDGDDWLSSDALARLTAALAANPSAVAACGRYARVAADGTARPSAAPVGGDVLERLLTRNLFANGGHLLIRREAIEATGGFRPDLSYGEDWEYWTRLALRGGFVAVRSPAPLLFVRERLGSAYLSHATEPAAYRPALHAIYRNPDIAARLGASRMACLRRRAEAEMAWTVGRELIRHGNRRDGRRWLRISIRNAPHPRRLVLILLSWFRLGPFRRYRIAA